MLYFGQLAGTHYLNMAILEGEKENTIPVTTLVHYLLCLFTKFL
jgi:hypothetical protein